MKRKMLNKLKTAGILCLFAVMLTFTACGSSDKNNEKDVAVENADGENKVSESESSDNSEETTTEDKVSHAEDKKEETTTEKKAETTTAKKTETTTAKKTETTTAKKEETTTAKEETFRTGTYSGSHKQQAMGSELTYKYSFTFNSDNTYSYKVSFNVQGSDYTENETGTYSVNGTTISLTNSEGTSMSGKIAGSKINITRYVSSFSFESMTITVK